MTGLSKKTRKPARYTLAALLLIVAVNAFAGGYYGMTGAPNVPIEWLEGSPFANYFIPGLILFVIVGGSCLMAAIAVLKHHHLARKAAMAASAVMLIWIMIQVLVIGYVSWMQPAIAICGVGCFFLALLLPRSNAG